MLFSFLTIVVMILSSSASSSSDESAEMNTARYFKSIQSNPQKLKPFLFAMPKGADLHMHATGATYAEKMLDYAAKDNLCINPETYLVYQEANCDAQNQLNEVLKQPDFKQKLIDSWSMRHFEHDEQPLSHDHFFSTFPKFYFIAKHHPGEVLGEIAERAASQNEVYFEVIVTPGGTETRELGTKLTYNANFEVMRQQLLSSGISQILDKVTHDLNQDEASMRQSLACDTQSPHVGCQIKIGYILRAEREQPPEVVFTQLLVGFEAAKHDHRIVGVNIVQPEDGPVSMRDYKLHMQMLGYLHQLYPDVHMTLHAGELSRALNIPEDGLRFHIHDAINVAHADRIGHGVDITYENNADGLFSEMAQKHIMVEINLTSNDQVLGIKDSAHPLPLYLSHGVPVSLSTDDEGVSRTNMTQEYMRAVSSYKLDYLTLKQMSRNSVAYSFLPGTTLWQDDHYEKPVVECGNDVLGSSTPSAQCRTFLEMNEKAKLQWVLEGRFIQFEGSYIRS